MGKQGLPEPVAPVPTAQTGPPNPLLTEVSYSSSLTQQGSGFFCLMGDFGGRTHTVNISDKGGADGRYPVFIPQAELW